jgi:2,3-bisphosphoglycerate-independent phosphoglycerate mutase
MDLIESLAVKNEQKILLVVIDGLGGLPNKKDRTELEAAWNPNLNKLATRSALGLITPIDTGITPGSGPAHLALFGYDPLAYQVGRGVLEALGVGLAIKPEDLCGRANFATVGSDGTLTDRRAGRIPTELCEELSAKLQKEIPRIEDIEVIVRPGIGHRFVVVFRGSGLGDGLTDSDPQHDGLRPAAVEPLGPGAAKSARVANAFIARCAELLHERAAANCVLLRGLALPPVLPSMRERFKLTPACIATYPMYRGLARLVGMDVLEAGSTWHSELAALRLHLPEYDFFFLHFKETDKAGEDGRFDTKQEFIETFDEEILPQLLALKFDVLCITGDHSTPATMAGHSWHSVPMLLNSPYVRPQLVVEEFGERACVHGSLGHMPSVKLMQLLLANALKLKKFGA